MIRPLADWLGAGVVLVLALSVVLIMGSCRIAHAEVSEIVLQTIAMESANDLEGMPYVASTLINRARKRHTSPQVEALRPKQYSCWNDRKWAKNWLQGHYDKTTRSNALKAYQDARNRNLGHYTHYHTANILPYWAVGQKGVRHGKHIFYSNIK